MTATITKPARRINSTNRTRKSISTTAELKPFPIVSGKYLFWFESAPEGGFSVSCQNVPGVNAEGNTFEEALADAMKCAVFVEKCHAEIAEEENDERCGGTPESKKAAVR